MPPPLQLCREQCIARNPGGVSAKARSECRGMPCSELSSSLVQQTWKGWLVCPALNTPCHSSPKTVERVEAGDGYAAMATERSRTTQGQLPLHLLCGNRAVTVAVPY